MLMSRGSRRIMNFSRSWLFLPIPQKGLIICSPLNLLALRLHFSAFSNELGLLSLLVFRQTSVGHSSARFRAGSGSVLPVYGLASRHALDLRLQAFVIAIERLGQQNQLFHQMPHVPAGDRELTWDKPYRGRQAGARNCSARGAPLYPPSAYTPSRSRLTTVTPGCSFNHFSKEAAERSGGRSATTPRCKSTRIVP